jgi:hypothetical protein
MSGGTKGRSVSSGAGPSDRQNGTGVVVGGIVIAAPRDAR